MSTFHKLTISDVKKETESTVSIAFTIPENLTKEFQFLSGQYLTLKAMINNEEVRRAYSICSLPNQKEIRVAVKQIENGKFSTFANNQLSVGDTLEVSIPEGKFNLAVDASNRKDYLFFAAGSGITPIMSMLKSTLLEEPNSKVVLVYGNKTIADTVFYAELEDLKKNNSDRFTIQYVFSKENPLDSLFGRIDDTVVNYVLLKNKADFDQVFLCGPEQMINTVKEVLTTNSFDESTIHYELFTASTESKPEETVSLSGDTTITVLLDDEETTFSMSKKNTILAASLKEGLDAPYSCQGGVCSSCIGKITKGKAVMDQNNILSKDELEEGLVLACQAHPTTDELEIDFDEV